MRGRAGRRGPESGSTAVEFVFWTPLLLLILLALVQLGLYLFALHVAETAAQAGDRAARQDEPSDKHWVTDSDLIATQWVNDLMGPDITGNVDPEPRISPVVNQCTPQTVTFTISFTTASLLGHFQVKAQSQGPIENYYPDNC